MKQIDLMGEIYEQILLVMPEVVLLLRLRGLKINTNMQETNV